MIVTQITPKWKKIFKDWGIDKERQFLPNQSPNDRLTKKVLKTLFTPEAMVAITKSAGKFNQGLNVNSLDPILREKVFEMVRIIEDEKWKMKRAYDEKIKQLYLELKEKQTNE